MAVLELLNDLADYLRGVLSPLGFRLVWGVSKTDRPGTRGDVQMVLLGVDFTDSNPLDRVLMTVLVEFELTYYLQDLRSQTIIYPVVESVRESLTGHRLGGSEPVFPIRERQATMVNDQGYYEFGQVFGFRCYFPGGR